MGHMYVHDAKPGAGLGLKLAFDPKKTGWGKRWARRGKDEFAITGMHDPADGDRRPGWYLILKEEDARAIYEKLKQRFDPKGE